MIGLYNQTVESGVMWLASGTTRTSVRLSVSPGVRFILIYYGPAVSTWQGSEHNRLHTYFSQLLQLRGKVFLFLIFVGKCWGGRWPCLGPVPS